MYHRLDDLSNRNIFLKVLGAERFKIRMLAWWDSGEGSLLGLQVVAFLVYGGAWGLREREREREREI
jgi:hypothetical protein